MYGQWLPPWACPFTPLSQGPGGAASTCWDTRTTAIRMLLRPTTSTHDGCAPRHTGNPYSLGGMLSHGAIVFCFVWQCLPRQLTDVEAFCSWEILWDPVGSGAISALNRTGQWNSRLHRAAALERSKSVIFFYSSAALFQASSARCSNGTDLSLKRIFSISSYTIKFTRNIKKKEYGQWFFRDAERAGADALAGGTRTLLPGSKGGRMMDLAQSFRAELADLNQVRS